MGEHRHFTGRSFNVYLDSGAIRHSFDSLEGVPLCPEVRPAGMRSPWFYTVLERCSGIMPGVVLAAGLAWLGVGLAESMGRRLLGFEHSPISPILVAVGLGLLLRNGVGLPKAFESGLAFCVKRLLRVGVALLGLRLSLGMLGQIGLQALPIVVCTITLTLAIVTILSRWLGVAPRLGSLIGVGTAICGVSAIVATAPSIDARKDEIGYAVGVITIFGMAGLFVYPLLAHALFAGDPVLAGYFLGAAIHDTSQVAGAGLMYQVRYGADETLTIATTAKLVRNLMMGGLVPLIAVMHHRQATAAAHPTRRPTLAQTVPVFILGFVLMAALRSWGDMGAKPFGLLESATWQGVLEQAGTVSTVCLTLAMAAVGLGTDLREMRQLGMKPMVMGFIATLVVGAASALLVLWLR